MKKFSIIYMVFFISSSVGAQSPLVDPHWQLIWEDNFNSLNTNIWYVANNFDHFSGLGDGFVEPQVYTNRTDNVFINNGNLVLKVRNETYSCPQYMVQDGQGNPIPWGCTRQFDLGVPYNYTSGWIETTPQFKPLYGYIEAKCKLQSKMGLWPAFWTYTTGSSNSNGSEVQEMDIFEMVPGRIEDCVNGGEEYVHGPNIMTTNAHYSYPEEGNDEPFCIGSFRPYTINDYREWHTYGLEWSPTKFSYYLDGNLIRSEPNQGMHDPATIILNLALNPLVGLYDTPGEMRIDYVKYYKLNMNCSTHINSCSYNFSAHTNSVKGSYVLGGNNCSIIVPNNQIYIFRASNEVIFNGGFEVPVGSQIYVDSGGCY